MNVNRPPADRHDLPIRAAEAHHDWIHPATQVDPSLTSPRGSRGPAVLTSNSSELGELFRVRPACRPNVEESASRCLKSPRVGQRAHAVGVDRGDRGAARLMAKA